MSISPTISTPEAAAQSTPAANETALKSVIVVVTLPDVNPISTKGKLCAKIIKTESFS